MAARRRAGGVKPRKAGAGELRAARTAGRLVATGGQVRAARAAGIRVPKGVNVVGGTG